VASPDRKDAIAGLARRLRAEDLVIFVRDLEVGAWLPAPGFPQTLPEGEEWQKLLRAAESGNPAHGTLPVPGGKRRVPATAHTCGDDGALVVLGADAWVEEVLNVVFMLPLVTAALRAEMTARHAEAYARMEEHEAQEMRLLVTSLEDARRQAQEAVAHARAALQTRDQFVAMASHELKTPLASLTLQVQLLERMLRRRGSVEGQWDRIVEGLRRLHRQVDRLTKLADDLLDVSVAREGLLRIEPEPVGLAALVEEIVERFQQSSDRHGSSIELMVERDVTGEWDPHRLDQVFTNLLSNAMKYGEGHPIQVVVDGDETTARVIVRDRGVGIAPDDIPRIFKRFERIGRGPDPGGIGLGLHIASEIVRLHRGTISVESELGKGTAFLVTLPK
jgi:signal transduction histidine kinase